MRNRSSVKSASAGEVDVGRNASNRDAPMRTDLDFSQSAISEVLVS
jgi:hypothetical protein